MRFLFVVSLLAACGQTANPNVCCVTEEQCEDLGAAELRPCGDGQACAADHTCVAGECTTNADCTDDEPVCRLGFCEGTCTVDDDCAEVIGRTHCGPDGTCVGCVDSSQCSGTTTICDMEEHACRGCEIDSECASGVCIEMDGVCAEESRVIFAGGTGSATSGNCLRAEPCKLEYALTKVGSTRDVVHITAGIATLPTTTFNVTSQLILDGAPTQLIAPAAAPTLSVSITGVLTLENLLLGDTFVAQSMGVLRAFDVEATGSQLTSSSGTLFVDRSVFRANAFVGSSGTFTFRRSETHDSTVSSGGTSRIERNRFECTTSTGALSADGGTAIVENNVFVTSDKNTDMIHMTGGIGSVFQFNTIASTDTTASSSAIYCDATIRISSNIFAYNSTNPITGNGPCTVTSSLFDQPGASDAGTNTIADRATFFVDLQGEDFHLSSGSPARNAGDPGAVTLDLEGRPRDSMPDVGAYEGQ